MGALNEDMRWDNGDVFQTRSGSWIERLNQLHDHRAQSEWDVFVFFFFVQVMGVRCLKGFLPRVDGSCQEVVPLFKGGREADGPTFVASG